MNLALYSNQIAGVTDAIDARLFAMLPPKPRIGYIPSSPDPERTWFTALEPYYSRYGAELSFFGLEDEFDASQLPELLACDAIHLTGGNTFQFLYWLRKHAMGAELRRYVQNGGVLIGVSAGAILMTPDISSSLLCGDEPYPGLDDTSGLGLVDFAVFPHCEGSRDHLQALSTFSASFPSEVIALTDSAGIVVEDGTVEILGEAWRARHGQRI